MFMLLNTVKDKLSFGWANSITKLSITSEFSFQGFNGCQSSSLFCQNINLSTFWCMCYCCRESYCQKFNLETEKSRGRIAKQMNDELSRHY